MKGSYVMVIIVIAMLIGLLSWIEIFGMLFGFEIPKAIEYIVYLLGCIGTLFTHHELTH